MLGHALDPSANRQNLIKNACPISDEKIEGVAAFGCDKVEFDYSIFKITVSSNLKIVERRSVRISILRFAYRDFLPTEKNSRDLNVTKYTPSCVYTKRFFMREEFPFARSFFLFLQLDERNEKTPLRNSGRKKKKEKFRFLSKTLFYRSPVRNPTDAYQRRARWINYTKLARFRRKIEGRGWAALVLRCTGE